MTTPVVHVSQGSLRGCVGQNADDEQFYKFLGIPYAKPPIKNLRFQDPSPADNWNGVRDCTKEGDACYHVDERKKSAIGSEDCLFLNVYTKQLPSENKTLKPVMVWIHGGAFTMGSGGAEPYGPEFLLREDIVLVTINYRLGILGFLRLKDSSLGVPGNAALKDQSLALKWVKENISNFNGDPNNITIFGESAGSASVHYHVLSPMSRGLFHKAILQSGCALNHWTVCDQNAVNLVKEIEKDVKDEAAALEILRDLPVEKLIDLQKKYDKVVAESQIKAWGPVIEPAGEQAFISQHPIEVISSGNYNKVPMIMGYNNNEGLMFPVTPKEITHETLARAIDPSICIDRNSEEFKSLIKKMEKIYFQGRDKDEGVRLLMTDSVFVAGIIASVKNHASTSPHPIYLYRMTVESSLNFFKKLLGVTTIKGACHADDIGYLFKNAFTPPINPGSLEDISIKRFVRLWTNFAKYSNPTPKQDLVDNITWENVTKEEMPFLDIGAELTLQKDPEPERISFWREVYQLSSNFKMYL